MISEATDWQSEVLDLKRQGLDSKDIAEAVGKHAATVRKVIARAREEGTLEDGGGGTLADTDPIPGQTTVDDFVGGITGPPRILWTGENRQEVAKFLGRGENGTIVAQKIDLPSMVDGSFVQATPGDTIIKVGENAYAIQAPDRDLSNVSELDDDVDPLARFRAEAGEAVGDMPPLTPPEPGETEVVAPVMPGTRQLVLDFGPNAAPVFSATVKFTSEKWPSGHFGMGDLVSGTFTARVVGIPAKEKFDRDIGEYVAAPLTYSALITEIDYEPVEEHE